MDGNNQSIWGGLSRLWWILQQQRRRRRCREMEAVPVAPGAVTLDPQADGVRCTLPSLPAGATGLALYKTTVATPDLEDYTLVASGLEGVAGYLDATGGDENGPAGWGNTLFYYLVQAEGSGLLSPVANATTVDVPATPAAPTLDPQPDGVHWLAPALPARALSLKLQKQSDGFPVWQNLVAGVSPGSNGIDALGEYDGEWLGPEGYAGFDFHYRIVASNIYGSADGTQQTATTVALPDTPESAPAVTNTGTSNEAGDEYWMEVTMPETLPARAVSFRLFASGSPGEPGDDRGLWAASEVVNTSGSAFGGGNPCGGTLSVGCQGHNIYGDSVKVWSDNFGTPAC